MTKNDFLLMSFTLTVGFIVLAIATSVTFAVPCNKHIRSRKSSTKIVCESTIESVTCQKLFENNNYTDCAEGQGITPANLSGIHYFDRTLTGKSTDHAIVVGSAICGYVTKCITGDDDDCVEGSQEISEITGKPIERSISYYGNESCTFE